MVLKECLREAGSRVLKCNRTYAFGRFFSPSLGINIANC